MPCGQQICILGASITISDYALWAANMCYGGEHNYIWLSDYIWLCPAVSKYVFWGPAYLHLTMPCGQQICILGASITCLKESYTNSIKKYSTPLTWLHKGQIVLIKGCKYIEADCFVLINTLMSQTKQAGGTTAKLHLSRVGPPSLGPSWTHHT